MNIYLDIDGVLLTDSLDDRGNPTNHSEELIKYLVDHHDVYWLTTHCHGGENRAPEHLADKFPTLKEYLYKIKQTDWGSWKTDAIDFSQDFRWLDDDVYKPEYDQLIANNCADKLIEINLKNNPEQLGDVIRNLKNCPTKTS